MYEINRPYPGYPPSLHANFFFAGDWLACVTEGEEGIWVRESAWDGAREGERKGTPSRVVLRTNSFPLRFERLPRRLEIGFHMIAMIAELFFFSHRRDHMETRLQNV